MRSCAGPASKESPEPHGCVIRRLSALGASPQRMPASLARAMPSLTRSQTIERLNSAITPIFETSPCQQAAWCRCPVDAAIHRLCSSGSKPQRSCNERPNNAMSATASKDTCLSKRVSRSDRLRNSHVGRGRQARWRPVGNHPQGGRLTGGDNGITTLHVLWELALSECKASHEDKVKADSKPPR